MSLHPSQAPSRNARAYLLFWLTVQFLAIGGLSSSHLMGREFILGMGAAIGLYWAGFLLVHLLSRRDSTLRLFYILLYPVIWALLAYGSALAMRQMLPS